MSREVLKEVFARIHSDEEFFQSVVKDASQALADYDLTEKEVEFIEQADGKTLKGLTPSCFELAEVD